MQILIWFNRQMDKMANIGMRVSIGCLFLMVILINVEVVGRYFLNFSTLIADEYSAYLFVGCSFLGFAYTFRKGDFPRVNTLTGRLTPRYVKYFRFGACIIGFLFSITLTYETGKRSYVSYLYHSKSLQPSMTPLFIPQLMLPIGMASMAIIFLNDAIQALVKKVTLPDTDSGKEVG